MQVDKFTVLIYILDHLTGEELTLPWDAKTIHGLEEIWTDDRLSSSRIRIMPTPKEGLAWTN